jgi:hypothetical protein
MSHPTRQKTERPKILHVGAFDVKFYADCNDFPKQVVGGDVFCMTTSSKKDREDLQAQWERVPYPKRGKIWIDNCETEQSMSEYIPILFEPKFSQVKVIVFIAWSESIIAGVARCIVLNGSDMVILRLVDIQSKQKGSGHALMVAVETVARAYGMGRIDLMSDNWISTKSRDSCMALKSGTFKSLNTFYKNHGFEDTHDACRIAANDGGTIKKELEDMSKCLL